MSHARSGRVWRAVPAVLLAAVTAPTPSATAASKPRPRTAHTIDADRDGRVDAIRVRLGARIGWQQPLVRVDGFAVRYVQRASASVLVVRLVERRDADTSVRPVVRFPGWGR